MGEETDALVRRLKSMLAQAGLEGVEPRFNVISTGCRALDERLPEGGVRRGTLVEWLSDSPGCGATQFALRAAREVQGEGAIIVVDRTGMFYPPAAAACRIDLTNVIIVHPANEQDEEWGLDQALRCEHAAAVLAWPRRIDDRAFRRLQLAAERSGALGLLVRSATTIGEPSWADVRLQISPRTGHPPRDQLLRNWRLEVRLLRFRGWSLGQEESIEVEIDQVTGEINEASPRHLAAESPVVTVPGVG
jgi:protein ImuA